MSRQNQYAIAIWISNAILSLLSMDLNYAVAPKWVPVEEIVCAIADALRSLPATDAEKIRQYVWEGKTNKKYLNQRRNN